MRNAIYAMITLFFSLVAIVAISAQSTATATFYTYDYSDSTEVLIEDLKADQDSVSNELEAAVNALIVLKRDNVKLNYESPSGLIYFIIRDGNTVVLIIKKVKDGNEYFYAFILGKIEGRPILDRKV